MKLHISKSANIASKTTLFFIEKTENDLLKSAKDFISEDEVLFIKKKLEDKKPGMIVINRYSFQLLFYKVSTEKKTGFAVLEDLRKTGNKLLSVCEEYKSAVVSIISNKLNKEELKAMIEGLSLTAYQFIKFKSDTDTVTYQLKEANVVSKNINEADILETVQLIDSVYLCRDFVNEPVCNMNSTVFSEEIMSIFKGSGAKVEVLNKAKIEALKMNGLLSVNKGSTDPPAFAIIEWKPEKAVNKNPVVFVGKGLMFDTGGINVKTAAGMETMKCDMAGGAAVVSAMDAIVKAKLSVFVVGIVPITDNRPSGNSVVPGDIITYANGTTVEVLNSDAEGRLILADGIIYAGKFKPEVIITIATLTGAAHAAIGGFGIVGMNRDAEAYFTTIQESGNSVFERVVEFPFWDEYDELIKSEIADIKNIGGPVGGAITAGKFLARFTEYPFIHLDIAGPSFNEKRDNYRGLGGSGVGVRLFFDFINRLSDTK